MAIFQQFYHLFGRICSFSSQQWEYFLFLFYKVLQQLLTQVTEQGVYSQQFFLMILVMGTQDGIKLRIDLLEQVSLVQVVGSLYMLDQFVNAQIIEGRVNCRLVLVLCILKECFQFREKSPPLIPRLCY